MKITKQELRNSLSLVGLQEKIITGQSVINETGLNQIKIFVGLYDEQLTKNEKTVIYKSVDSLWKALHRFETITFYNVANPKKSVQFDGTQKAIVKPNTEKSKIDAKKSKAVVIDEEADEEVFPSTKSIKSALTRSGAIDTIRTIEASSVNGSKAKDVTILLGEGTLDAESIESIISNLRKYNTKGEITMCTYIVQPADKRTNTFTKLWKRFSITLENCIMIYTYNLKTKKIQLYDYEGIDYGWEDEGLVPYNSQSI
jgi:hypothetical protein